VSGLLGEDLWLSREKGRRYISPHQENDWTYHPAHTKEQKGGKYATEKIQIRKEKGGRGSILDLSEEGPQSLEKPP